MNDRTSSYETGLVSTILPIYNRPEMLREAVQSVLDQTYRPIEIVIVDDGSSDETPSVGSELATAHEGVIRFVRQANAGPGMARNTGLRYAHGEFIQYLDSDDLLLPNKFSDAVARLRERPDCGVAYALTLRAERNGHWAPWARTAEPIDSILPNFLMTRGWHTVSPLWRRSVCDAVGEWRAFRVMEDWEHDCRAGLLDVKPVHCPEPGVHIRDHQGDRACGRSFSADVVEGYYQSHASVLDLIRTENRIELLDVQGLDRKLFWLARHCGRHGMDREARSMLGWADMVAKRLGSSRIDLRCFSAATRLLGWPRTVQWSEALLARRTATVQ